MFAFTKRQSPLRTNMTKTRAVNNVNLLFSTILLLVAIHTTIMFDKIVASFVRDELTASNIVPVYYEDSKYSPNSNMNSFRILSSTSVGNREGDVIPPCDDLYGTQFSCVIPPISNKTYEFEGCQPNNTVKVSCTARDGVTCSGDRTFYKEISCFYTNGYYFSIAMALSVFFGICGIDRFYLGHVGYGLFKLFTFGGFGILWIYDIVLIAMQQTTPRDGSNYIVGYNGPRNIKFIRNNNTYVFN
ncbi:hypothetical protein FDP41_010894 [Naegleria fowleri]|uniref:TM2 domain-containing protein n=1 Tax=Naegleria fowleri TaxID=5763 RepID=A0A6A5CC40_NAEFO|nr:uncharacterized protein FDP41_010894 [Naegleria fowleri]KAF0982915.1 hypothetical protein FDP41_010894 [Naegleria fowleri]